MKQRIVLGYSGGLASSVAICRLATEHEADIITLTLDLGQSHGLDEVRARALALGAVRAHVLDVRGEFAREYVLPALQAGMLRDSHRDVTMWLAAPLIAKKLADIGEIENTTFLALGTDLGMTVQEQQAYARAHNISVAGTPPARRVKAPAASPETPAHVDISFSEGLPTSINGIPMHVAELLDSLTTIAGEHGIGSLDGLYMPAAIVMNAAYTDGGASPLTGTVRLKLFNGTCEVVGRTTGPDAGNVSEGASLTQV